MHFLFLIRSAIFHSSSIDVLASNAFFWVMAGILGLSCYGISRGPALTCYSLHMQNSNSVTLLVVDLNSKISAKNSSSVVLCFSCSAEDEILKANPVMDLGHSCNLCC